MFDDIHFDPKNTKHRHENLCAHIVWPIGHNGHFHALEGPLFYLLGPTVTLVINYMGCLTVTLGIDLLQTPEAFELLEVLLSALIITMATLSDLIIIT